MRTRALGPFRILMVIDEKSPSRKPLPGRVEVRWRRRGQPAGSRARERPRPSQTGAGGTAAWAFIAPWMGISGVGVAVLRAGDHWKNVGLQIAPLTTGRPDRRRPEPEPRPPRPQRLPDAW